MRKRLAGSLAALILAAAAAPAAAQVLNRDDGGFLADQARRIVASAGLRPDGASEAWEWFNPDTGKSSNPLYAATVALPYLSLKAAGLLAGSQSAK